VIASMTGYGRGEAARDGMTVSTEVRSVNSRYLDITLRVPRGIMQREKEIKEIVRTFLSRGNVNVTIKIANDSGNSIPVRINAAAARSYYKLLSQLRRSIKIRESIKLEHLLTFSDILEPVEEAESDDLEWTLVQQSLHQAMEVLNDMRIQEGCELSKDFEKRIGWMDQALDDIEKSSMERIPEERKNLHQRISQLLEDKFTVDQNRLEMEIALLADRLDVTEECVRYRSHNKFFLEALKKEGSAGRKLNFLVQEMNREANTIGSKSNDTVISHKVIALKEELEKIREQLQNVE
jgi:uncharacterized protein (TIGR00255 family)